MFGERIGFLKFKADILDKGSGHKVSNHLVFNHCCTLVFSCLFLNSDTIRFQVLCLQEDQP